MKRIAIALMALTLMQCGPEQKGTAKENAGVIGGKGCSSCGVRTPAPEEIKSFDSFKESTDYYQSVSFDVTEGDIKGCRYVIWEGSHREIGYAHQGTCTNPIHCFGTNPKK